jgi:hypothetical protein
VFALGILDLFHHWLFIAFTVALGVFHLAFYLRHLWRHREPPGGGTRGPRRWRFALVSVSFEEGPPPPTSEECSPASPSRPGRILDISP